MRCVDCLAILFSGGKVYLILFLGITIKINQCCVITLAQYILTREFPSISHFCYIKAGFSGVYMSRLCYRDAGIEKTTKKKKKLAAVLKNYS